MKKTYHILSVCTKLHHWWALFSILLMFPACQTKQTQDYQAIFIQVDTASIDKSGKKFIFKKDLFAQQEFNIGGYLSSKEAYSGTHSVLLTGKKIYGLSTKFHNLEGNEHFIISIWRKDISGKSALVVQGDKTRSLYIAQTEVIEKGKNGWEKIEVEVEIPPNIETITIYAWKIGADSAFFDDMLIRQLPPKIFPAYTNEHKLHLYFSDAKMRKFEQKRLVAFNDGVLLGDGEWMKGILSNEKNVMPIKARFKGDWLDHLMGSKWSFRIKMRDDYTFNRMRVFSLQNPVTRYYLNEFISHKLFASEDILTTRYGFIPLYLNGKSLGVYAWEEHFSKQLIEFNLRREGPIVKLDEDPLWKVHQHLKLYNKWLNLPYYETSRAIAFGMGKTLKKPSLKAQFNIAQGLLMQYKNRKAPIAEIFNIDVLAKYWAILDISNGRHGVAWHNQRMYYNPVLCKLEPINYDNYTDYFDDTKHALISALLVGKNDTMGPEHNLIRSIFRSTELLDAYIPYLEKYSNEEYLKAFINQYRDELDKYGKMISVEVKSYSFQEDYFYRNAADIREKLPELKRKYNDGFFSSITQTNITKVADTTFYPQLVADYVNAYYYQETDNNAKLILENYNGRSIEILGLANSNNKMLRMISPITLKPFVHFADDTIINISYTSNAKKLIFKVSGYEDVFFSELSLWKKNTGLSPYQTISHSFDLSSCKLFEKSGDSLIVKAGKFTLSEKILIPKGKKVIFEAGVEIDMTNQAAIISHSPVYMIGTEAKPIKIYSSDTSANAFTLLQAKGKSKLEYVIFSHLNTLNYDGWTLSGAVNFYESDVDVTNCVFENNHCEDALNIIRSDFHVTKTSFLHIFADAFDSDFCTGLLDYSKFNYVGNDAIDFSTSQITIDQCIIKNISDKGISGGEGSTLKVSNTSIIDCNIGVASKDLSHVELSNTTIENCSYGLVALRKKPEYGPATIQARKLKLINCNTKYLIEKNSVLELNGRQIIGTQKKVAELFY